jgi:hypothetical protein
MAHLGSVAVGVARRPSQLDRRANDEDARATTVDTAAVDTGDVDLP